MECCFHWSINRTGGVYFLFPALSVWDLSVSHFSFFLFFIAELRKDELLCDDGQRADGRTELQICLFNMAEYRQPPRS